MTEMMDRVINANKVILTLGFGALFAALGWLHGKIPDQRFFTTICLLLISLGIFFAYLILESCVMSLGNKKHWENCRKIWPFFFFPSLITGIFASGFVFYSAFGVAWYGVPIDMIAVLEREKAALETQLDTALRILHHERLMHFGIASGDVERVMREKTSADLRIQLGK